jgi:hypothetical protein
LSILTGAEGVPAFSQECAERYQETAAVSALSRSPHPQHLMVGDGRGRIHLIELVE